MTHPAHFAAANPAKPAYILAATGETVSYEELEANSNRFAHAFRELGAGPGGHIALAVENRRGFFEICWGAQRAGLRYTPISWRLQANEIVQIVADSGAQVLIVSDRFDDLAASLSAASSALGPRMPTRTTTAPTSTARSARTTPMPRPAIPTPSSIARRPAARPD